MVFQSVHIILRLGGKPAADMVDCDHAIFAAELLYQMTPCKAPGRIAVNHQQHRASAFVDVVHDVPADFHPMRSKRVFVAKTITLFGAIF